MRLPGLRQADGEETFGPCRGAGRRESNPILRPVLRAGPGLRDAELSGRDLRVR